MNEVCMVRNLDDSIKIEATLRFHTKRVENYFRKCLHVEEGILECSGSGLSRHEEVETAGGRRQLGVVASYSMKRFGH